MAHPGNVTVENRKTGEELRIEPDGLGKAIVSIDGATFTVTDGVWHNTLKRAIEEALAYVK